MRKHTLQTNGDSPVSIRSDDGSRDRWLGRLNDRDLREAASRAHILFLPSEGHADYEGPLFPEGTRELFHSMRSSASDSFSVEVASSDEDYAELTLHSAEWILPIIWVMNDAAAQVLLNIVASHLYDRLKRIRPGTDVRVKSELILSDRQLKLKYDGPAEAYVRVVSEVLNSRKPHSQTSDEN